MHEEAMMGEKEREGGRERMDLLTFKMR